MNVTKLRAVPDEPPSTEQILRDTLRVLDDAQAVIARLTPLAIELGRDLIRERNPHEREYMKPDLARIRRELKRLEFGQ